MTRLDPAVGPTPPPPLQRSFDQLGTPLHEVTFCVIDLETTGGDANVEAITEIGAVKIRGGEVVGTFQTLVDPGRAIPPTITVITGITNAMVTRAPKIDSVWPSLAEFVAGTVLVGHNVRFDLSFLDAAARRRGDPVFSNPRLDTLALARRLLADEVPRFGLGELAKRLRLPHTPTHRALDDALATMHLLHVLIERATAWGVSGLDDLLTLPTIAGHPQAKKLDLTTGLPRKPGVYQFVDGDGRVLYVGKATDLRARVRSYFSSERRRKVAQMLRETQRIQHRVCPTTLEAEVLEQRLIEKHQPRFNRRGKRAPAPVWVRLTDERFPRLTISRKGPLPDPPAGVQIGPLASRRQADEVVQAIWRAVPIRRCTTRVGRRGGAVRDGACASAQLGVALCPCSEQDDQGYGAVIEDLSVGLASDPVRLTTPLQQRMLRYASEDRFEEAASVRASAQALVHALQRQRRATMFDQMARGLFELPTGQRVEVLRGGVVPSLARRDDDGPISRQEQLCVAAWFERHAATLRPVVVEGELSSRLPRLPDFTPRKVDRQAADVKVVRRPTRSATEPSAKAARAASTPSPS